MAEFPEAGVKLVAETGDAMSSIESLAGELDSLTSGSTTVSFDVEVDSSALDSSDIPTEDTEVTTTQNLDVVQSEDDKKAVDQAEFFFKTKNFETVWNWTVKGLDIFMDVGGKLINPILDLGDAVAEVGAKTGDAIPNADELINKIFYDDIGKSKEEVGQMIIAAHNLGLPIEEAVRAAGTFTHTWSDESSVTAINAFGALLKTNLVDSMQEASDLMAVFFQNGGNKGNDALQVVEANAQSWSDMGLTASQALSTITTLLNGNVDSATDAAKMIQTLDDALTTAAADAKSPQSQLLKSMGLDNPKDKGQQMGADFIDGFAAAFATMPSDQQDLISSTFMGKGGKKFTGAIEEMTANSDMFKNVTGAAELAAKAIDDSLRGAIDDFVLEGNKRMEEFLSSKAIDLPGKINALKGGLQDALNVLAEGGTLGEALTIALKPIGFDDEFQGLEAALGNFVIGILQAVEAIQRALPGGGTAADQTAFTIHQMARQQLAFDLQIANPDEIAGVIKTATERGLDPAQIASSIGTTVDELVKNGAPEAAQAIIDAAKTSVGTITFDVQGELERKLLESQGQSPTFTVPVTPEMTPEDIQKTIDDTKAKFQASGFFIDAAVTPSIDQKTMADLQSKVDDAFRQLNPTMEEAQKKITDTSQPLTDMANSTTQVKDNATNTKPKLDALAAGVSKAGGAAKEAAPAVSDTAVSIDDVGLSAMAATVQMEGFGNQIDIVAGKLSSALGAADAVNTKAANTPTSGPHAAGGMFTGTALVGENGPEIVSSNHLAAVLNNATTRRIMDVLSGYIPGGVGMGGRGGNNFTAINNNIVQSEAQADALGYSTAAQLRGMANQ